MYVKLEFSVRIGSIPTNRVKCHSLIGWFRANKHADLLVKGLEKWNASITNAEFDSHALQEAEQKFIEWGELDIGRPKYRVIERIVTTITQNNWVESMSLWFNMHQEIGFYFFKCNSKISNIQYLIYKNQ